MQILHFATEDARGGAAKATYRVHRTLRDNGMGSSMLVARKGTDDPDVREVPVRVSPGKYRKMRWMQRLGFHRENRSMPDRMFNFDVAPDLDTSMYFQRRRGDVDILMLHWVTGLLTVDLIHRLHQHYRCPIVWLLMDMEPITGGCHYPFDCEGYTRECGNCPQIEPRHENDASQQVWKRKRQKLGPLPITLVAANSHARRMIFRSSLFAGHPVADIPIPLDRCVLKPADQAAARAALNIPQGARAIFFGATSMDDPRKGIPELIAALKTLGELLGEHKRVAGREVVLLIAGRNGNALAAQQPFPAIVVDYLQDDVALACAYQAADVFVCPSVEDGGPMMVAEAMMCGTPVVAFHSGMAPDLITHRENGYLAEYRNSRDLAQGLQDVLECGEPAMMRELAWKAASRAHAPEAVYERYRILFDGLHDRSRGVSAAHV